ncbi:MAG TPA: tetratricopeptide repeat protein [Spirochaetota bacterium]|nr:tetratricopeptide repeat protein [Spirochaetota bacterium]HPG49734.1 tetratricopeptide repeat protein [Spirochaetota bacterium]
MAEVEEITYTPEELQEIERIVDLVGKSGRKIISVKDTAAPAETAVAVEEKPDVPEETIAEDFHAAPESFDGEPDDLELPAVDLKRLDEKPGREEPREEPPTPVEDITGLIHEVAEEYPEVSAEAVEPAPELPELPEEEKPAAAAAEELDALGELDSLTSEEPESMDHQDKAPRDTFVGKGGERAREPIRFDKPAVMEELETIEPDILEEPAVSDLGAPEDLEAETGQEPAETVNLGREPEADIPDLSEISFEEKAMPEARESDIPELDIGAGLEETAVPSMGQEEPAGPSMDELTDEDLAAISDVGAAGEEPSIKPSKDIISEIRKKETARSASEDLGPSIPELPTMEEEEIDIAMPEDIVAPAGPARSGRAAEPAAEGIELTDRELNRVKKAILLYNPGVRQVVKDVVINDLLPLKDTRQLINLILSGRSESDIQKYLEGKLGRKIQLIEEMAAAPVAGRRVITARPEYTREGRDRQKRLLTITKIFGAAAAVACVLMVVGYQFIYKPWAAKRMIREGTALIRESGDYLKKPKDYAKAEEIFRDVDANYIKNFVYGYTEYSRAYFDKREYTFSIEKMNKIYAIQYKDRKLNVETPVLLRLGDYYSKVPAEYYNTMRLNINQWYYPGSQKKREEWSQLDVAIEFYRRVLVREPKNIDALYGVGNAYFYQGQYFKAKKYYEDIINVNPDSVIGYAGLMNLYIERNVFQKVIDVHAKLVEKKMLDELPSALLAKLASYYLDKQATATENVRIEYGVQSPRFKDADDNLYPAVKAVLAALNKRDKDYPPLHLQLARLSKAQNNLKIMKIHLEKAIELSGKNYGADYFGALHLMGEYYYQTREPVEAYKMLNRAIKAADNPPEFTREDFYRETESAGKSYALQGNIFYYYFDKIQMRYGDLEDEVVDDETDKLANYQIAKEKYEKAIEEGFESSEVHYNLGRVYYLNRQYQQSLDQWLNLYEDFMGNPELMFALGNAFYHMGNPEAAKGEYLKLISAYEYELDKMKIARYDLAGHVKLITFMSGAYNNLGAVYQIQGKEAKSDISYWKAIDYAQRIGRDNEFARVNMARSFKQTGEIGEPILDESIPYSIDVYREDMRR